MKLIHKYITNISALQFIQLLRFSVLFLIGVVFVRYYSKQEIGQYETMLFVASALSFFWLRGILQTFLSLVKEGDEKEKKGEKSTIYFSGFLLLVSFSLLAVVFLVLFRQQFQFLLAGDKAIPFFNWLLIYLLLASPSNFIEYVFLAKNKPVSIFIYGGVSYGLQFLLLTVPVWLKLPIEYSIKGLVLISALRFIFLLGVLKKYSQFRISATFIRKHFKLAYPLVISSLLSGSGQYVDGAIVSRFFNQETFAIFRYGAREFPLVVILVNSLSHAMLPVFARNSLASSLSKLKANSLQLMHFLFPLSIVILFLSHWLFELLFTSSFLFSAKIFNIYLLLIIVRIVFPETILIGKQITGVFLKVSFVEIVVNIACSLVFVKYYGLTGIVYATLIANLLERIILMRIVKVRFKIKLNDYVPLRWYSFYSLMVIISFIIVENLLFPIG